METSAKFRSGDAGLIFDIELRAEGGEVYHEGDTRGAKNLSDLEAMGYSLGHKKKNKGNIRINQGLRNALVVIADKVKSNLYSHSPVDRSRYKDNVVMRNNIEIKDEGDDRLSVGYYNIPYATRRNYESSEIYNKKGKNLQFIEKAWEYHLPEYQRILNREVESATTDILTDIIQDVFASSGSGMAHRHI